MSEERGDMAVDEALATVQATLAIDPSPALEVRVRERIAQVPPVRVRPAWGTWAAAAAAVVGGLVLVRGPQATRAPAVAVESPGPVAPAAPSAPAVDMPVRRSPVAMQPTRAAARRTVAPAEALVPSGEALRIARYVEVVRQRPFAAETLPELDPSEPLADPAPLDIPPLEATPLVTDEGSPR